MLRRPRRTACPTSQGALPARSPVRVRPARVARLLGVDIPGDDDRDALRPAGLRVHARRATIFSVTPPSYRFDLAIEEDFVEEIARLHGFDAIPARAAAHAQAMLPEPRDRTPRHRHQAPARRARLAGSHHLQLRELRVGVDALPGARRRARADPRAKSDRGAPRRHAHHARRRAHRRAAHESRAQAGARSRLRGRPLSTGATDAGLRPAAAPGRARLRRGAARAVGASRAARSISSTSRATSQRWSRRERSTTERAEHPAAASRARGARAASTASDVGWLGELHPRIVKEFELPRAPDPVRARSRAAAAAQPAGGTPVSQTSRRPPRHAVVVDDASRRRLFWRRWTAAKPPHVETHPAVRRLSRAGNRAGQEKPCDSGAYAGY